MSITEFASLQHYNTLALEARARALAQVCQSADLAAACAWARREGLPLVPLGQGSNIVLAQDLDALVVLMATRGVDILSDGSDEVLLRVAAGENWHELVQWALVKGLYGLENLALIPGTVGAAPVQNIGAYGVELASMIEAVHAHVIDDDTRLVLSRDDCAFGYRDSVFKHGLRDRVVITAVDLRLSRRPRLQLDYPALAQGLRSARVVSPTPIDVFNAVIRLRRSRLPDPAVQPNAGSFFLNPLVSMEQAEALAARFPALPMYAQTDGGIKLAAGWLIDFCGWKGYRNNNLGIHPQHALVLVNYGNESGRQLLQLAETVAQSVADTFGVQLVIEPRVYGE